MGLSLVASPPQIGVGSSKASITVLVSIAIQHVAWLVPGECDTVGTGDVKVGMDSR